MGNTGTARIEEPMGKGAPTLTILNPTPPPGKRERHALRALSAERTLRGMVATHDAVAEARATIDPTLATLSATYADSTDRERIGKAERSARDRAVSRVQSLCADAGKLCDPKVREEAARQMDAADRDKAIKAYDAAVDKATKAGLLKDKLATYGPGASTGAIRKATAKVRALVTLAS